DTPDEETTDWRAVCGKTARTVRRAGRLTKPSRPPITLRPLSRRMTRLVRSIRLFDESKRQRPAVDLTLESFRRDGDGLGGAVRRGLGLGGGERGGQHESSGGEDECVFAHESLLRVRRGRRLSPESRGAV